MGIYEALFSALFNLFSLYISIRIIKLFLPARKTGKVFSASLCMGVWVFNWMLYYFFHIPDLTTMSLFFGLLAIAVLLFEGGIWRKGFAVIVSLATGIISENIVWKIFTGIPLLSGSEAAGAFCSVVLEFLILLCVERFVFIKRYKRLPAGIYANSLLIATGSAVLSEIIVLQAESKTAVWIGMSMICLINLSTYYTYEKNAESWEEKLRHAQMEQQLKMYANQFDIIEESRKTIRAVRHDMKNHLSLIGWYLQRQEYGKAQQYLSELGGELEAGKEYVRTGNVELDSILNYKLEYGEKKAGSDIKVSVEVPDKLLMPAFDLNVLLSNLLDNAIEAVQKADDRLIDLKIRFSREILYVSVYNTFDGKLREREGKLFSTKKAAGEHVIGLENVKGIVEKYNGTMKVGYEGEFFQTDIVLFLEAAGE